MYGFDIIGLQPQWDWKYQMSLFAVKRLLPMVSSGIQLSYGLVAAQSVVGTKRR